MTYDVQRHVTLRHVTSAASFCYDSSVLLVPRTRSTLTPHLWLTGWSFAAARHAPPSDIVSALSVTASRKVLKTPILPFAFVRSYELTFALSWLFQF
jgi:hypothetical protein